MSHLRQIDVFLPDFFFNVFFCFAHGVLKSLVNSAFVDQRLLILNFISLFIPSYNVILFNFRICFIAGGNLFRFAGGLFSLHAWGCYSVCPSVRLSVCLSVCPHKWKSEYSDLSTSWQLFFNIRLKKWRVEESNLLVTDLYHIHNYLHNSTNNTFSEYPQICFLILPNNMKCEKNFGELGGLVKFIGLVKFTYI